MTTGANPPLFTVRVTVPAPDRARVHVGGEIDMDSGPRIEDLMVRQIADGRVRIEVDLGSVEFMDSSGIHMLLRVRRQAQDAGGGLDVLAAGPRVVRLLEVTGLTEILPVPRRVLPALDADAGTATGSYTWNLRTDAWWWSPETYRILGLAPGSVRPSTDLVLGPLFRILPGPRRLARTLAALQGLAGTTECERAGPGGSPKPCALRPHAPDTSGHPASSTEEDLGLRQPDDVTAEEVAEPRPEVSSAARVGGEPFTSRHRLLLADGSVRTVAVVGEVTLDASGEPVQMTGFFVDVSDGTEDRPDAGPDLPPGAR
ncbi:anti-sigma factor antagonist [Streptodolium elevatio]